MQFCRSTCSTKLAGSTVRDSIENRVLKRYTAATRVQIRPRDALRSSWVLCRCCGPASTDLLVVQLLSWINLKSHGNGDKIKHYSAPGEHARVLFFSTTRDQSCWRDHATTDACPRPRQISLTRKPFFVFREGKTSFRRSS